MCHGGIYSVPALSSCSVPLYSFFPRHASAFALSGIKFTDFSFVFPFPSPKILFSCLFRPILFPFPHKQTAFSAFPFPSVSFVRIVLSFSLFFSCFPLHSLPGKIFRSSLPCPDLLRVSCIYCPGRNLFYSSSPGVCSVPQMNQKINPRKGPLPRFRSLLSLHNERLPFNETVRRPQWRRTVMP